jgi:hypothetical protein
VVYISAIIAETELFTTLFFRYCELPCSVSSDFHWNCSISGGGRGLEGRAGRSGLRRGFCRRVAGTGYERAGRGSTSDFIGERGRGSAASRRGLGVRALLGVSFL